MPFLMSTNPVVTVSGSDPIVSTGGSTPIISIQNATVDQKGAVQLEDSTASTSIIKAATPKSVKDSYDHTTTVSGALKVYIDEKSVIGHDHDERYYTETELNAGQLDDRYYTESELDAGQLDDRYYTEIEIDGISDALQLNIDGKSDTDHLHDDRYYTESEVDNLITTVSGKLDDHNEMNNLDYDSSGHIGFASSDILSMASATELTLVSGTVTRTQTLHRIDTEGDVVIDDLDTILGGIDGDIIIVRAENGTRTVILKDGTGNLKLGGRDLELIDTNMAVMLFYSGVLGQWLLIGDGGGSVTAAVSDDAFSSAWDGGTAVAPSRNAVYDEMVTKSDLSHLHDDRYYTESEVDTISGTLSSEIDFDIVTHTSNSDAHHNESHTIISHSDTTATGANLNELVGAGDTTLHKHDGQYYTEGEVDTISGSLNTKISAKSDTIHTHTESDVTNLDKYTQAEVDTVSGSLQTDIDTKSDTGHIHDDRYYTESEVDGLITTVSGKLDDHNEMNNLDYASSGHTGFQQSAGINVETLTADKTLIPGTDKMYQYLDPDVNRIITLDTAVATAGDRFIIRHNGVYNETLYLQINQGATTLDYIYAGAIKEFIFDGTNWISASTGTGENDSKNKNVAIGYAAYGAISGIAVGYYTNGSNEGVAVGYDADGSTEGVAVGIYADGSTEGAAMGAYAQGYSYGTAVGNYTKGYNYGAAIGYYAKGMRRGAALGYKAGYVIDTAADRGNIVVGYQAGDNITTGNKNIIIGYDIDAPITTGSNQLSIGNLIFATGIDGTGTTISTGNVGIGTTAPNSKLTVAGNFAVGTNGTELTIDSYGNLTLSGTVDGRDIATDGSKLDGIDTGADVTADNPPQVHTHDNRYYTESEIDTISGSLQTNIDGKSGLTHLHDDRYYTETELNSGQLDTRYYTESEVDALITTVSGKLDDHNEMNNLDYVSSGHTGFQPAGDYATDSELTTLSGALKNDIDGKSDTAHLHDDRYYTESEVDTISGSLQTNIDGKSDAGHLHDDRYYTESEVNTISGSLQTDIDTHGHVSTEITVNKINTPTYDTLQGWLNNTQSAGRMSGGDTTPHIDAVTGVTVSGAGYGEFKVSGDQTAGYIVSETIHITGSTNNNGYYTVASGVVYSGGTTTIPVEEAVEVVADGNITNGTVDVADGTAFIKQTDSDIGETVSFNIHATTNIALTDITTNYVYVDYNVGTPDIKVTTDEDSIEKNRQFPLSMIYKNNGRVWVCDCGLYLPNRTRLDHDRILALRGYDRASGGEISEYGTRNIQSTSGEFYRGTTQIDTTAKTSVDDKLTTVYYDGSAWVWTENETQIDNTYYNDIATGLVELGVSKYAVHWVCIDYLSNLYVVYGRGSYSLSEAQLAGVPSFMPVVAYKFGIIAAKIIIQKTASSFEELISAYTQLIPTATPAVHNNLSGLNDGDYKHLTAANHTDLTDSGDCSIHKHDDRYYTESEVDTISGSLNTSKSDVGHSHTESDISDLDKYTQAEVDVLITTVSGKLDDHNELNNLDYASSGHTGFQPSGDYVTDSELTTLSGNLQTNIDEKDNYSSWNFAVDGSTKDAITSGDVLDFVGGDNITIIRSADDQITISGSAGGGGGLSWEVISIDTTAVNGSGYLINASSENITLTLPSTPSEGDTIGACDIYEQATASGITIARNGSNIEGAAEDLTIDVDGSGFTLVYADATRGWEIVSEIGGSENSISDTAYGVGWDGVTDTAPSKNAVYDEMETKADKGANADITSLTAVTSLGSVLSGAQTIPAVNLTGGQIAFPATAVPSADPNTLDDYEEGDFTPYVYDASSGGNQGGAGEGTYTKIGDFVPTFVKLNDIDITGLTGENTAHIRELPFTVHATFGGHGAVWSRHITISYGIGLVATAANNTTRCSIYDVQSGANGRNILVSDIADDAGDIEYSLSYKIA